MNKLVSILRAAHCRSTHHYFAVDALSEVATDRGKQLVDVLLKNHAQYLAGAKAPDVVFRDFKNHVVHVDDGNWGGAVEAANRWYVQLLTDLDSRKFGSAAYSAGVLSHYVTDPMMPLHTGQSEIESVIHRPMEWSICKAYDDIHADLKAGGYDITFQLANYGEWLEEAILASARVAHQFYQTLIDNYDLAKGVDDPPSGLNKSARETLAQLFGLAIHGLARILERAADETSCEFPPMGLSITTLLATIDVPFKVIVKRVESRSEQQAVAAIFREWERNGTVQKNLPEEIRMVRENREADRMLNQQALDKDEEAMPIVLPFESKRMFNGNLDNSTVRKVSSNHRSPSHDSVDRIALNSIGQNNIQEHQSLSHVSLDSNVVDAPSIGPSTAERLAKVGIRTIGDLLSWNAAVLSIRLNASWIKPSTVQRWKDQAILVCDLQSLRGHDAQLLVAAGICDTSVLANSNADGLLTRLIEICSSPEGQSILRGSPNPDLAEVTHWIGQAKQKIQGQERDSISRAA